MSAAGPLGPNLVQVKGVHMLRAFFGSFSNAFELPIRSMICPNIIATYKWGRPQIGEFLPKYH